MTDDGRQNKEGGRWNAEKEIAVRKQMLEGFVWNNKKKPHGG